MHIFKMIFISGCLFSLNAQIVDKPPVLNEVEQRPVTVETKKLESKDDSLLRIVMSLSMKKKVHIFSDSSRFFEIKTVEKKGLGTASIKLPKPVRYRNFDGTTVNGYSGKKLIEIAYPIQEKTWNVRGYIQYQACDNTMCFFPEKQWFTFSSDSLKESLKK